MLVCGNTASMVSKTRYAKAFKVIGDRSVHFGIFEDCGADRNNDADVVSLNACC